MFLYRQMFLSLIYRNLSRDGCQAVDRGLKSQIGLLTAKGFLDEEAGQESDYSADKHGHKSVAVSGYGEGITRFPPLFEQVSHKRLKKRPSQKRKKIGQASACPGDPDWKQLFGGGEANGHDSVGEHADEKAKQVKAWDRQPVSEKGQDSGDEESHEA